MTPTFHAGELGVQERAGVRDEAARLGRSIRPHIPLTAHSFLFHQPMVILATADTTGRLWASLVSGEPGFLQPEDEHTLRIDARPTSGDPLLQNLTDGAHVGVLVIDLGTRRRLRLNGRLTSGGDGAIRVFAEQVYSNCPKYIQARSWGTPCNAGEHEAENTHTRHSSLTDHQRAWVAEADTFFVASSHVDGGGDASHRGGPPGFVHVSHGRRLVWADYAGNNMFQTLGNISVNPRTGLLFIDFERGKTLQLTGSSRIVWDVPSAAEFPGAQRLLDFELEEAVEIAHATPLRWRLLNYSPFNPAASPEE